LWIDTRGPNPLGVIPLPLITELPLNSNSGYPFITYYFRTISVSRIGSPAPLSTWRPILMTARCFISTAPRSTAPGWRQPHRHRQRHPRHGYTCSGGDASCPYDFSVSGPLLETNLVIGDNVLAVEVHNYNARSPDITFGLSLDAAVSYAFNPKLNLAYTNGAVALSWDRGGFTLQQANSPTGAWINASGPVFSQSVRDHQFRRRPLLPPKK